MALILCFLVSDVFLRLAENTKHKTQMETSEWIIYLVVFQVALVKMWLASPLTLHFTKSRQTAAKLFELHRHSKIHCSDSAINEYLLLTLPLPFMNNLLFPTNGIAYPLPFHAFRLILFSIL